MGGIRDERIDYTSDFYTFCKNKKGIVTITNYNDNLCLARALDLAISFLKKDDSPAAAANYNRVGKSSHYGQGGIQFVLAQRLCREAKVELTVNGGGVEELSLVQQYFTECCITVFSDRIGTETIFETPGGTLDHPRKHIDLIFGDKHYNVITSVNGAFTAKTVCRPCKYADSNTFTHHRCPTKCPACIQPGLCEDDERVKCNSCNRSFFGQECFHHHFLPSFGNDSACQTLKKCTQCLHTYSLAKRKRVHVCGESLCTICDKFVPPHHLCYVQPAKPFPTKKPFLFVLLVFFDFECTQEAPVSRKPDTFELVPNLCIAG